MLLQSLNEGLWNATQLRLGCLAVTTSGVTGGLSHGVHYVAEGGPLATIGVPLTNTLKKELRKNSQSEYRGCLFQLKKTTENQRILNTKISAKGGPVFTFSLPGEAARALAPPQSVAQLITTTRGLAFVSSGPLFSQQFFDDVPSVAVRLRNWKFVSNFSRTPNKK